MEAPDKPKTESEAGPEPIGPDRAWHQLIDTEYSADATEVGVATTLAII